MTAQFFIPPEHRAAFAFDEWAHSVSYLGGAVGGLVVALRTFVARAATNTDPRRGWVQMGCASLVLGTTVGMCSFGSQIANDRNPSLPALPVVLGIVGVALLITSRLVRAREPKRGDG